MRLYWHTVHWHRIAAAVIILTLCGVLLPLIVISYLDNKTFTSSKPPETTTLTENEKIRLSVRSEKLDLEKKRTNIKLDIENLQHESETSKVKMIHEQEDLIKVAIALEEAKRARSKLSEATSDLLREPLSLSKRSISTQNRAVPGSIEDCTYDECFDYSRCPLKKHMRAFFYPIEDSRLPGVPQAIRNQLSRAIRSNVQSTSNADEACIFVLFVSSQLGQIDLSTLTNWNSDGANHVIVIIDNCTESNCKLQSPAALGRAMVARQTFKAEQFRDGFDVVLPPLNWSSAQLPYLLPVRRKYLLSFSGWYNEPSESEILPDALSSEYLSNLLKSFGNGDDRVAVKTDCSNNDGFRNAKEDSVNQWIECQDSYTEPLSDSTFALLVAPDEEYFVSSDIFINKLFKVIQQGSIPVILGDHVRLPFDKFIQWRKAAIMLAKARAPELHLILKTISDEDLFAIKRQGHRILQTYFATADKFVDTLLSLVRYSVKLQPLPEKRQKTNLLTNLNFGPVNQQISSETDEILGPLETPYPSLAFQRNFSLSLNYWRDLFNVNFNPHVMAAWRPTDPVLPSDAKFRGSSFGFRPIGFGAGGSGKEFSEALGGNYPREQFTAVILTYERPQVLLEGIISFKGLPYLNKVLVVWNGPDSPGPETLTWPEIGVPVQVVKTRTNSLNNRFVPWDAIETEAVLSVDDDARLRHDELIFAFRVWRENRDRIVGFPGRFHAFDTVHNQWNYDSNHSCELSMVLTGAAFFHKYYMYEYTYRMFPEIGKTVDELMNCEDIALNFLVSHLTRKPPLKVTSKWTFRCPGCPVALSEHDSHFLERHDCINKFTQLYGYNPLLYTQLRADSVLFKTRVPHDKQKCFKYI